MICPSPSGGSMRNPELVGGGMFRLVGDGMQ